MTTPIDELAGTPLTAEEEATIRRNFKDAARDNIVSRLLATLAARSTPVPASNVSDRLREAIDALPTHQNHLLGAMDQNLYLRRDDVLAALAHAAPERLDGRYRDPKYLAFVGWASSVMRRRLEHGRAKFGVDWDEQFYGDEDNLERLRRAVDHLEAARASSPDPAEWEKRAADVANQAFMFADPARIRSTALSQPDTTEEAGR
jgi:hypothetical protein